MSRRIKNGGAWGVLLLRSYHAVFKNMPHGGARFFGFFVTTSTLYFSPAYVCHAEELADPTRPPAAIGIPAAVEGKNLPPGLQSVIISKSRRTAIIDGETVELRGKHGDATLIEVTESGVVLQGAQGRQVLTLFPDVKIMQKEIQATPKLPAKEGGVAQKNKPEARKEHK